jgi:chromosome segregation ATPase
MSALRSTATLAILLAALSPSVHAQTARSGGAPNAQLMQQMQQLASERTSLQAENAKLKKELEDIRKERDQLKKGQQVVEQRVKSSETALSRSAAERASTEQELTQTKAKMQDLIAKFRETVQTFRDVETQSTTYKQSLAARDQELKTCIDRNLALYHLNDEVLTRLDKQGVLSRMAQAEPFTRIKRVELENLIDEYKGRAEDQRVTPGGAQTSSSPPASK